MKDIRISPHFKLSEFVRNLHKSTVTKTTIELVENHASMLEIIRREMNSTYGKSGIRVNSGVRVFSDILRLEKKGYHPSPKSDHFYGLQIPCRTKAMISKFGKTYGYTVGASDLKATGDCTTKQMAEIARNLTMAHEINPKQVIHETDKIRHWEWLHIASDPFSIYSEKFCDYLWPSWKDRRFLKTTNGGKKYFHWK